MTMSQNCVRILVFSLTMGMSLSAFAKFSYEGYLTDSSGHEVISQAVRIKLEIHTPSEATSDCLFYAETQNVTTGVDGYFSVIVGSGTRIDSNSSLTFDRIFENRGSMTTVSPTCSYTPAAGAGRNLKVYFSIDAGATYDNLGILAIQPAPMATVAESLSGFTPTSLLRAVDGSGNPTTASALTPSQYTEFQALLNGTSTHYAATSAGPQAIPLPSYTSDSPPSSPVAGSIWYDQSGSIKYFDGSTTQTLGAGGGGGISALTGDITASGTGSVAATVGSVGTSSAANVHAAELLANAATSANTASAIVKRDASGGFVSTNASLQNLILRDLSSNTVTVKVPSSVTTSYNFVLPTSVGANGQMLVTDGAGNLSWQTTGGGGTVTNVVAGSGLTGGPITGAGTLSIDSGTTANKVVQLDGTARLPAVDASMLTSINANNISGGTLAAGRMPALSGDVTTSTGSTATTLSKILTKTLSGTPSSSGQVLRYDGTTSWQTGFLSLADIRSTVTPGNTMFPATSCTSSQTMTWSSLTDTMTCASVQADPSNFKSPASGSINLNAGGSNSNIILMPSGTGMVGIGTTAPIAPFHYMTTYGNADAIVTSQAGDAELLLTGPSGSSYPGIAMTYNHTNQALQFTRVTNGSPSSYPWVTINGGTGQYTFTSITGSSSELNLDLQRGNGSSPVTASTPLARVAFDGYNGSGYSSSAAMIQGIAAEGFSGSANGTDLAFSTTKMGFATPAERMRISSSGNVGIGTTNPTGTMQVISQSGTPVQIFLGNSDLTPSVGTGLAIAAGGSSGNTFNMIQSLNNGSSGSGAVLALNSNGGNVGVGTNNPTATLDVHGHIGSSGFALSGSNVTSCGSGATVNGNDSRGMVTVGTTTTTSCQITFNTAYSSSPFCVTTWVGASPPSYQISVSPTTTTLYVYFGSSISNYQFMYHCMQ